MRGTTGSKGVAVALLGVVVFDLIALPLGLATIHPTSWVPVALANLVMLEVAIVVTRVPAGPDARLFGASVGVAAVCVDVVAIVLAVVLALLDANVYVCLALFLVLGFFVWRGAGAVDETAEDIATKQAVTGAERRVVQQLLVRMNALLGGEHDVVRRRVLSRANDALRSCPVMSRDDVVPYDVAIEASLSRLEQLERAGAELGQLEAEVAVLCDACAARNALLRVR